MIAWSPHFKYTINDIEKIAKNIAGDDAWRKRDLLRKPAHNQYHTL